MLQDGWVQEWVWIQKQVGKQVEYRGKDDGSSIGWNSVIHEVGRTSHTPHQRWTSLESTTLYLPSEQQVPAIELVKCLSKPVLWMMGAEQPMHQYLLSLGCLACGHVRRVVVSQIPEIMHSQARGQSSLEQHQSTYHLPFLHRQSFPCILLPALLQNVYWSWWPTGSTTSASSQSNNFCCMSHKVEVYITLVKFHFNILPGSGIK